MRSPVEGAFLFWAVLCLSVLVLRTVYELLKRAGKLDPRNPVIFTMMFAAMVAFLASWPMMGPLDPWRIHLPAFLSWMGMAMIALALVLALGGMWNLRGVENI
jgi:hypothetical protein